MDTPGSQVTIGVTYKLNGDHLQAETAKLELWKNGRTVHCCAALLRSV